MATSEAVTTWPKYELTGPKMTGKVAQITHLN